MRSEKHERKGPSVLSMFSEDVLEESFLGAPSESPALLECAYFLVCIIQCGFISIRDLASSHFLYYNRLLQQNMHCIFFIVGKRQHIYDFLISLSRSYKKKLLCEVGRDASTRIRK